MIVYKDIEIEYPYTFKHALQQLGIVAGDLFDFASENAPTKEAQPKTIAFLEAEKETTNTIQTMRDKEYISIKDFALFMGISEASVYNWKNKGYISFYGIGGRTWIKFSEVEAALIKF